jgi:hypothetical protein
LKSTFQFYNGCISSLAHVIGRLCSSRRSRQSHYSAFCFSLLSFRQKGNTYKLELKKRTREQETMNATRQQPLLLTYPCYFVRSFLPLISKEVTAPAAVASKVFFRNWLFQRRLGRGRKRLACLTARRIKVKRSKNQPQKPVPRQRWLRLQKSRYVKRKPRAHCEMSSSQSTNNTSLTLPFFSLLCRPLSRS